MQRVTIQAVKGGIQVVTAGQTSTTLVEGSFPSCTVSVFNTGTAVLVPNIYGDNLSPPTPKSNPFTADATGAGFFYAPNGTRCDIQLSGTGIVTPFVVAGDVLVDDGTLLQTIPPVTVVFSATPTFDLSQASWFIMTLTGNVTVPAFSNPVTGQLLILSLIQNAAGNHTFAFPAAFIAPPAIALGSNARTELIFKYDGTNWTAVAATGDSLQVPTTAAIVGNTTIGGTLAIAGGTPLATTNQTGTGSIVLANTPTLITPVIGAATGTSLALGGGTPLTTTNRTGTGNLVLQTSPALITPDIGVATGTSLALGGGTPLATTNRTGTGNLVLATSPTIATPTLTSPVVNTGITATGSGFKHGRVTTGSIGAGARAAVTFNWSGAFADTNYTEACTVEEGSSGTTQTLVCERVSGKTAGSITVTIFNPTGGSLTGTLNVIAVHD